MNFFLFATLLVGCYMLFCAADPPALSYVIVIDAGSTGNRATGFSFSKTSKGFKLEGEKYVKSPEKNVGLSQLSTPAEGAQKIEELLEMIKKELNLTPDVMKKTPIVLKGTGGLRMLNSERTKNILLAVSNVITKSEFLAKGNVATILSGVDEAVFSWFSVNYLLDLWETKNTFAALDLGGSSTQVTFSIKQNSNDLSLNQHLLTVSTRHPNVQSNVFSTSYSELGAESVRQAVFSHGNAPGAINLTTICMHPQTKPSVITFGSTNYTIHGSGNSGVDFEACKKLVQDKTLNLLTPKVSLKDEKEIYAFSGFYFRFKKTGRIAEDGGQVTLNDVLLEAQKACSAPAEPQKAFLCLDLTYMYVLLHDGYELTLDTKVNFYKKLKGHDVSYALGAAFDLLSGIKRTKISTGKPKQKITKKGKH